MSKRFFLLFIIVGVFILVCFKKNELSCGNIKSQENSSIQWENTDYERAAMYRTVLEEYERATKDKSYTEEQWENIYDCVIGDRQYLKAAIYYGIEDITGDGTAELIIGVGKDNCYPYIIYSYEDGIISKSCLAEKYSMTIYEKGFIELATGGVETHYMYYQLKRNSIKAEYLVDISVNSLEDNYYIYENSNKREITEEEFQNIRNRYIGSPLDINWELLEGFWNLEDTVLVEEDLDGQQNR